MTVGELTVVIAYLGAVYGPLSSIAHTTGQLQGALAGAQARAGDVRDAAGDRRRAGRDRRDRRSRGDVRFEDVGFPYPDGTTVLHDITFAAEPGRDGGARRPDRRRQDDARQPDSAVLRRDRRPRARSTASTCGSTASDRCARRSRSCCRIRCCSPGTIADNLRYGRLDATDAEIEEAARAAHAHEFISRLPKRYDTPIAEAGGGLSGGERQRLSVARAILKNAPILILDEPTSSLDAISEEIVFAALRRLRAGRTTIVIAHRLSTVRDADRILVLDGGRIAAQGRHEELLKSSQLYRRMCARLSVGKSLDEPETVDELIQAART